jgi:hypothetical protein
MYNYDLGLENSAPILTDDSVTVQDVRLYASSAVPSVRDYCSATGAENFVKAGPVQSMIIPKSQLTPQPRQSGGGGYGFGNPIHSITGPGTGHGEVTKYNSEYNNSSTVSDSTNRPLRGPPPPPTFITAPWQKGAGRKSMKRKSMKKRMSSKRKSRKKYKGAGRKSMKSMKYKSMKYKSMKKSMKSKRVNLQRRISNYTKSIKNKTKKIKLNFKKRRSYRGGYSTPMFIQEFNTTLSPDESMLATPTPLTRTIRECDPIN